MLPHRNDGIEASQCDVTLTVRQPQNRSTARTTMGGWVGGDFDKLSSLNNEIKIIGSYIYITLTKLGLLWSTKVAQLLPPKGCKMVIMKTG